MLTKYFNNKENIIYNNKEKDIIYKVINIKYKLIQGDP